MYFLKYYLINQETSLIKGEHNEYGKLCSRVLEGRKTFLVDCSPIKLLDETLKFYGFNYKGAKTGAKSILRKNSMCPIVLNQALGICMFPINSPDKHDNIWFNPDHIVQTFPYGSKTDVKLSNGVIIRVNLKLSTFNNKLQIAHQYRRITHDRGRLTMTMILDEKKEPVFIIEENGGYNFDKMKRDDD
ncbi:competence protein ComK [Bacillus sp. FJAT-49705]|uniref:Competence protein ComK n=1 Tax=Cytobacillus citreus TaxID=2833586 RepID=A0ABS5NSN8_9BACI|nr:competence protein ComK [Cytobacillus citreus]MBS4190143.1 competence protein ComK [Cytobacillus citreus]